MTRQPLSHRRERGFSLVEMAIVLIIFTLLAGGMMMTLTTQQEIRRLAEVRRQLADIREALLAYAVINGRLPSPARTTTTTGLSDDLYFQTTSNSTEGVLPWATLGLPETDPWGQRFSYWVMPQFAKAIGAPPPITCTTPAPTQASFALCSQGDITVRDGNGVNIATLVPAIVISHGRNGLGGWDSNGKQRSGATGDELTNSTGSVAGCARCFVSREQGSNFDDEVMWISLPILMSRMLAAGRLP